MGGICLPSSIFVRLISIMMKIDDDFKKTRYYQDILKKAKLETAALLLKMECSIEEIAEALELDVEDVREIANQNK